MRVALALCLFIAGLVVILFRPRTDVAQSPQKSVDRPKDDTTSLPLGDPFPAV